MKSVGQILEKVLRDMARKQDTKENEKRLNKLAAKCSAPKSPINHGE